MWGFLEGSSAQYTLKTITWWIVGVILFISPNLVYSFYSYLEGTYLTLNLWSYRRVQGFLRGRTPRILYLVKKTYNSVN